MLEAGELVGVGGGEAAVAVVMGARGAELVFYTLTAANHGEETHCVQLLIMFRVID